MMRKRKLVGRAALLGYALAQAWMAEWPVGKQGLEWAEKAAVQGDGHGLSLVADCLWKGMDARRMSLERWCYSKRRPSWKIKRHSGDTGKSLSKNVSWSDITGGTGCCKRMQPCSNYDAAEHQLEVVDRGGSGRIVFEIALIYKGAVQE